MAAPWKSDPPVTNSPYFFASARYISVFAGWWSLWYDLDRIQAVAAQFRHNRRQIAHDAHWMSQRRDPAAFADHRDAFREGRLLPVHVAYGGFVQVIVKCLLNGRDVSLRHHHLREVRTGGQSAAASLHFRERDIETQALQTLDSAGHYDLAARLASPRIHSRKSGHFFLRQKISEKMDGAAVQFGGQLNSANQFQAGLVRERKRSVVSVEGVVVRDSEKMDADAYGLFDQLRR